MNNDFEVRVKDLKSRAHGHWTSLLRNLGVDEDILKGKNLPCPIDGCERCSECNHIGSCG